MKLKTIAFTLLAATAAAVVAPAQASIELLATASIAGNSSDLSGLTNTLENGAPNNLLGGFGSGIAYAGNGTFVATPDRGPNAVSYNSALDDTTSYIDRFQTFKLTLSPSSSGNLPFTLTPTLTKTTLLSSSTPLVYGSGAGLGVGSGAPSQNTPGINYFTGRSDGFDPTQLSGSPNNARLDPESIRVSNDGKSVFISDEYGPYVYQFDKASGQRIKTYTLPAYYDVAHLSPVGNTEISGNTTGRVANKGMEGLAITPDGKTLVGVMQSPLIQDGGTKGTQTRIVTIDVATGATHEYVYTLANKKKNTISDIIAINDHEFLVDERDGNGGTDAATKKKLVRVDITGATDVSGDVTLPSSLTPVSQSLFLDLLDPKYGLAGSSFPAKIEGLAFGDDVTLNGQTLHTLVVTNDNDFLTDANSNFYVFGFTNADLPGYVAQQLAAVPEPETYALMGLGLVGLVAARKRKARQ